VVAYDGRSVVERGEVTVVVLPSARTVDHRGLLLTVARKLCAAEAAPLSAAAAAFAEEVLSF